MVSLASFVTLVAPDLSNRRLRLNPGKVRFLFFLSCLADSHDASRARARASRLRELRMDETVSSLTMSAGNLQGGRVRRRFALGGGQVNRERAALAEARSRPSRGRRGPRQCCARC